MVETLWPKADSEGVSQERSLAWHLLFAASLRSARVRQVSGKTDQLIRLIEAKTGTTRREIEEVLDNTMKSGESIVQFAAETVRNYATHASDVVKGRYDRMNTQVEAGFVDAQEAIRSRPGRRPRR